MPTRLNEIAISSGLEKLLLSEGYGKELFIGGVIEESINSNNEIEKIYQKSKVVVVGLLKRKNHTYIIKTTGRYHFFVTI